MINVNKRITDSVTCTVENQGVSKWETVGCLVGRELFCHKGGGGHILFLSKQCMRWQETMSVFFI